MAPPSQSTVLQVARQWWRVPGRPALDDLRADVAPLFVDPDGSVRITIVGGPPIALSIVFETRDPVTGVIIGTVTQAATKADLDGVVPRTDYDLGDVQEWNGTPRLLGEVP